MLLSLRSIAATNFRGVRSEVSLDFSRLSAGLYFVRGQRIEGRLGSNGAGKSTLFSELMTWVLQGRLSRSARPGSSVENRGGGKPTLGKVVFSIDGTEHLLQRTRNPNNLFINDRKVEQLEMDSLLPLGDDTLHKTVLLDQFGSRFLDMKPEAKSGMFSEALGLNRWLDAAERAQKRSTAAANRLQNTEAKINACERALAEVKAQLKEAIEREEAFDDDKLDKVKAFRDRAAQTAQDAQKAERAALLAKKRYTATGGHENARLTLQNTRVQRDKLRGELADARAELASAIRAVKSKQEELKKYDGDDPVCPECGQTVTAGHRKEMREAVERSLTAAIEKRDSWARECPLIEAEFNTLDLRIGIEQSELDAIVSLQRDAEAAAREYEVLTRLTEVAVNQLKTEEEQKNPFTVQCDRLEKRVYELRKEVKELNLSADADNEELEACKYWVNGFRAIRLEQLDTALLELETATNRHAEALGLENWEIQFATEKEKKTGGIRHGFVVFLFPPGADEPVPWETYSGGEGQRWQHAATFGLAEVLLARAGIEVDFEVIDEPTQHLSAEGVDDLLACLSDRARELGRRIFLIDHNVLDRGYFDGVINVIREGDEVRVESELPVFAPRGKKRELL